MAVSSMVTKRRAASSHAAVNAGAHLARGSRAGWSWAFGEDRGERGDADLPGDGEPLGGGGGGGVSSGPPPVAPPPPEAEGEEKEKVEDAAAAAPLSRDHGFREREGWWVGGWVCDGEKSPDGRPMFSDS